MKRLFLVLIILTFSLQGFGREVYTLNNDWRFFFKDENSGDDARYITLPHTWNMDALDGSKSYRQTTANYRRLLYIPEDWRGRRLFLRFHGVQSVADVFVNGSHIGEHRGGWTGFTFEITNAVSFGAENRIFVSVSNAYCNDVLPTSTEVNMYGGIYRDVELIVTEPTTVSPTLYGTDGIAVRPTEIGNTKVEGFIDVTLTGRKDTVCSVEADIVAPDGYVTYSKNVKAKIDGKTLAIPFSVENPELWSPTRPKLYEVVIRVGEDEIRVTTGFRKIEVTPDKKFTVNGKRVYVHGMLMYHDCLPQLSAYTSNEYNRDIAVLKEVGANALRSVVGPHDPYLYDLCDKEGVLVWIDSPLVQSPFLSDIAYYSTIRYEQNAKDQLSEIIYQNRNHPSVVMWGIFSMLRGRSDLLLEFVKRQNALAKKLDPSRPTVACSNRDGNINFITDLIVWQQNIGWNGGSFDDLTVWQDALRSNWSHLCQAICYGENGKLGELVDSSASSRGTAQRAPEAVHTHFHEGYARQVDENLFWGIWINSLFDFGSTRYVNGVRTSGLVAIDHYRRKDAFYLYKTLWNKGEKTLYIIGKNRNVRRKERQAIRLYSSHLSPTLTINGDEVAIHELAPGVFISDSLTMKGENMIEASASGMTDRMTLTIGNAIRHRH